LKSRPARIGTPSDLKKPGEHGAEACARIVFTVHLRIALGVNCASKNAPASRHGRWCRRPPFPRRQLADLANRFAIERQRLRSAAARITGT
jgi:hypothetical protein